MQLVLDKNGIALTVKNRMFCIRNSTEQLQKVPISQVTSILINKSISFSSDAMFLAIENEIEVIFIDGIGRPKGRVWSHKFGSISVVRRNQLEFSKEAIAVTWVQENLVRKIDNQQAILISLNKLDFSTKNIIDKACKRLHEYTLKIKAINNPILKFVAAKFRGYEGNASRIYFETISSHFPDLYKFPKRTQFPAADMFNSMLNYAYGILYSKVEGALIKAGIDPYIGVFHRDEYNRPSLVYDVIERYRVWADFVVIDLCMQQVMFKEFFVFELDVCLMNSQGKRILIQAFNDYFEEVIRITGTSRSRSNHIEIDAQKLATFFKTYKSN